MSYNIDPKKTGSLNEGGRRLKVGTFAYKIDSAENVPVKTDPRGKEKQIVLTLSTRDGYACKVYLSVMNSNETVCEIAQKTLVAFWDAAGLNGVIKPANIKRLAGNVVVITAKERQGKGDHKDKTYVDVATVEAYDEDGEQEEEEEEAPAEPATEPPSDGEEEQEEEEEEEEEEEPAPAPAKSSGTKRPWG